MIKKTNNSKVLVAIIVILMITNIVLVSLYLFDSEGGKKENRMDRKAMIAGFLKNEIGFTTGQLQQYDSISNQHRENIKTMSDSLKSSRDIQFKQLAAGSFSDSVMNMVADQSAASQKMMTMQMYTHVKKIRLLCTPVQLPRFDSLFGKVLNKRGNEGRKKYR